MTSRRKKRRTLVYKPRTYGIVAVLIDDFWEHCNQRGITPTLIRFEDWVNERWKGN